MRALMTECVVTPDCVSPRSSWTVQVTITGSNFADWDAIDARCRDPVYTDISRCSASTVCELVAVTASERQCRGQVRPGAPCPLGPLQWVSL